MGVSYFPTLSLSFLIVFTKFPPPVFLEFCPKQNRPISLADRSCMTLLDRLARTEATAQLGYRGGRDETERFCSLDAAYFMFCLGERIHDEMAVALHKHYKGKPMNLMSVGRQRLHT